MGGLQFYRCGLFRGEKSRKEFESCPLSGIKKRPPLGGYLCTIVISIRNTAFVRCREVVRFSEGGSTVGFPYNLILCFLVAIHGIYISLSTRRTEASVCAVGDTGPWRASLPCRSFPDAEEHLLALTSSAA